LENLFKKYRIYGPKIFLSYAIKEIIRLYNQLIKGSYSQAGEDLLIDKILGFKKKGFYIDIGASDPSRFNNTKRFYLKGWCGINVEPNIMTFEKIKKFRNRDINLNIGLSNNGGLMEYFIFDPQALSTFNEKVAQNYIKQGFKIIKKIKIEVKSLTEILTKYSNEKEIDFLSIDTEGQDLDILKSNNWYKFKPKVICVEIQTQTAIKYDDYKIEKYLKSVGYIKKFNNNLNAIFIDSYKLTKQSKNPII